MKRCLSILLAIALFVTLLPGAISTAFADDLQPRENTNKVLIWSTGLSNKDTSRRKATSKIVEDVYKNRNIECDNLVNTSDATTAKHFPVGENLAGKYDLVIVYFPCFDFNSNDAQVLYSFLEAGGRVVFLLEDPSYGADTNPKAHALISQPPFSSHMIITDEISSYIEGNALISTTYTELTQNVNTIKPYVVTRIDYTDADRVQVIMTQRDPDKDYPFVVEEAISKGRMMVVSDFDFYDSNVRPQVGGTGYDQFFYNLLLDSQKNMGVVAAGGDPNDNFGDGYASYRYQAADDTRPLPSAISSPSIPGSYQIKDTTKYTYNPTDSSKSDIVKRKEPGSKTYYEPDGNGGYAGCWTMEWDAASPETQTMTASGVVFTGVWTFEEGKQPPAPPVLTTYTLSYSTGGGTSFEDERHYSGTVVQLDKVPVREGYRFTGWYLDAEHTQPVTSVTMTKDITVYAGWKEGSPADRIPEILNCEDHFAYVVGYSDGSVRPDAPITRAETATMLYRLLNAARRDEVFTATSPFPDVTANLWYNKAVSSMANGKYITGYPDGSFRGGQAITRAEFVTMLTRFIGPSADTVCSFPDVDASYWAYPYIAAAEQYGWVKGYADGTFRPEDSISRAEVMTVLNRLLDRGVGESGVMAGYRAWPDNEVGAWYYWDIVEATTEHTYTGARPDEQWTSLDADWVYDIAKYEHPEA